MRKPFGKVLREIRKSSGISQENLALEAGVDRSYIGRLERGENVPTVTMLFTLAKVLGVKASQIIARMER